MKWMDEKGRLFGKVNLFDLLVLLALIAVVAAVGMKLVSARNEAQLAKSTKTYVVTVKVPGAEPTLVDAFGRDNRIYYDTIGYVNATIEAVRAEPASVTLPNAEGQAVLSQDPYLVDVYVDPKVEDISGDQLLKIATTAVQVGSELYLKTFYGFGKGIVVAITEP